MNLEILRAVPPSGVVRVDCPPLLFIHGAFAGAWCWVEHFMPWFATQGFECVAVSLRGHGGSDGREQLDRFGIDDFVNDVHQAAQEASQTPILVGHSMGGFVAMRYAEKHPTAGLVLLASVPPLGLAGAGFAMALSTPGLAAEVGAVQAGMPSAMSLDGFRRALFSDEYPEDLSILHGQSMGPESSRAVAEMHGSLRPRTEQIRKMTPVSVLGGQNDQLIRPAFVRATARAFGTTAEILPNMAHALMLDTGWERAAERIRDHARSMVGK